MITPLEMTADEQSVNHTPKKELQPSLVMLTPLKMITDQQRLRRPVWVFVCSGIKRDFEKVE